MKNFFLLIVLALCSAMAVKAQTFKFGVSAGLPMADAKDVSTFVLGVDSYYYFTNKDSFLGLGGTVGYRHFFADDSANIAGLNVTPDDFQFLPVAASARIKILGLLSGGLDVGYAFGISDNVDGGAYFKPVLNLIGLLNKVEIFASYETITDEATLGNLNLGVLFIF